MPRRRARREITFSEYQLFTFGSDEELVVGFGSLERAAEEWVRLRDTFLKQWNLWGMPQAWWRFEPEVPDTLRCGPPLILSNRDADEWRELEQARRRYLVSVGIDPVGSVEPRPFGRPGA